MLFAHPSQSTSQPASQLASERTNEWRSVYVCSFCHFCAGFAKSHACHYGLNRLAETILGFEIVTQYESIKLIYKSRGGTNRDRDKKKRVRKRHRKRDCERMHRINMRNQKLYVFAVIIAVLLAKWKTKYHRWGGKKSTRTQSTDQEQ